MLYMSCEYNESLNITEYMIGKKCEA